jgi:hypothetical protein
MRRPAPDRAGRDAHHMRMRALVITVAIGLAVPGCDDGNSTLSPTGSGPAVRVVFLGPTARRSNFPQAAQACLNGVGVTHIHPSWHNFGSIPLQPVPPDRYEITFNDVPVGVRVSFRINDQNSCDENPTGPVPFALFAATDESTR